MLRVRSTAPQSPKPQRQLVGGGRAGGAAGAPKGTSRPALAPKEERKRHWRFVIGLAKKLGAPHHQLLEKLEISQQDAMSYFCEVRSNPCACFNCDVFESEYIAER